jgi:hypothetical protein
MSVCFLIEKLHGEFIQIRSSPRALEHSSEYSPSLLKSERSSATSKLTYKVLIRPVMTYACPAWEFTADSHLFLEIAALAK